MKPIYFLLTLLAGTLISKAQIPTQSLLAYWNFDDNLRDTSGNGHHLIYNSTTANDYVKGTKGNGVPSGAGFFCDDGFLPSSSFTVGAWVKHPSTSGTMYPTIIEMQQSLLLRLFTDYQSMEGCFAYSALPLYACASYTVTTDTLWHHYLGVHDATGQMAYLYQDGNLITSVSMGATLNVLGLMSPHNVMVGYGPGGSVENPEKKLNATLDELLLYDRALDSTEVRAVWCDGVATPEIKLDAGILSTDANADSLQWMLNGAAINGANGKSYTPSANGDYTLAAFFKYGCSKTSNSITISQGTGVSQTITPGFTLNGYPNPTQEILTLESSVTGGLIRVLSLDGRLMTESKVNSYKTTIDTHNWAPGLYLVSLQTQWGTQQIKVVKN